MFIVISKPGTKCPKETNPRKYITDSAPIEVPATAFYRRLIQDGSLRITEPQASKKSKTKRS
jgi:hypothetical protein